MAAWDDAWQQIDEEIVDADHQIEVIDDERLGHLECHIASLLVSVKALQSLHGLPVHSHGLSVYVPSGSHLYLRVHDMPHVQAHCVLDTMCY